MGSGVNGKLWKRLERIERMLGAFPVSCMLLFIQLEFQLL
jgi:hypothetical protein